VPGITEVRAGTYAFNDLMQLGLGTASEEQLALTVLCTAASAIASGRLTIDGGSKTFSGDRGSSDVARAIDRPIAVERLGEEHGMAHGRAPAFMLGWMRMAIAATGAVASLAVGLATFLSALVPLGAPGSSARSRSWDGPFRSNRPRGSP